MAHDVGVPLSYDRARLADSRAQFVANLGRRLEAIRQALVALERSPRSAAHRDNLRRRVHALGAAAGVLGFEQVQGVFGDAEAALSRAAAIGRVTDDDLAALSRTLDLIPSLTLGGTARSAPESKASSAPSQARLPEASAESGWPLAVVLVGSTGLSQALAAQSTAAGTALECSQADEPARGLELLALVAPDVLVVDVDRPGARELIQEVLGGARIDPVSIVALGSFERPESAAGLVSLGVARVLPKPVGPETLRRTVVEVARESLATATPIEPIGDVTVEALADRVALEVRRGLVDAVKPLGRAVTVPLGDGTDALAAVWSAVARLRELVTMRSGGGVRFDPGGPEGAIPLAPWAAGDRRRDASLRGAAARDVDLTGRRIVVVDDDPSVVWFLSGLLGGAGATVFEAHDGATALQLCRDKLPDLVISDIVMPELDGFSLCREIKRDIILADVPVVLLSWKEDLLRRVRELGAEADGYLRKEAPGSAVLERVREVLWPRVRMESRIAAGGEVRGRLDGLTTRTLLSVVCRRRLSAHVSVRDSAYLYEIAVRDGRVRSVSRTLPDGATEQGQPVVAGLLGVRSARFVVRPDASECGTAFDADLVDLLAGPATRARAAMRWLAGAELHRVRRVAIDEAALVAYSNATPRQVRAIVTRLSAGARPSELVEAGSIDGTLLERVLVDLVLHGGVSAIYDAEHNDLLAAEAGETHRAGSPRVLIRTPTPAPVEQGGRSAQAAADESETAGRGVAAREAPAAAPAEKDVPVAPGPGDSLQAGEDDLSELVDAAELPAQPTPTPAPRDVMQSSSPPSAPLEFEREVSPLERALRASSGVDELRADDAPAPVAPAHAEPDAEDVAPVAPAHAEPDAEDVVAVERPQAEPDAEDVASVERTQAEPSVAALEAGHAEPDAEDVAPIEASHAEPPAAAPRQEAAPAAERGLSDEALAFAALVADVEPDAEDDVSASDTSESDRPRRTEPGVGPRSALETKAAPEPSPFAAAFDRLSSSPPEPGAPAEASAQTGGAGAGWSIALDEESALPGPVKPSAPEADSAGAEASVDGGWERAEDDFADRVTVNPEDRQTREMHMAGAPPQAFRSTPPEASGEARELGEGLAEALAGDGDAGDAQEDAEPVLLAPAKRIAFPSRPPRPEVRSPTPAPAEPTPGGDAEPVADERSTADASPPEASDVDRSSDDGVALADAVLGDLAVPEAARTATDPDASGSTEADRPEPVSSETPPTEPSGIAGRARELAHSALSEPGPDDTDDDAGSWPPAEASDSPRPVAVIPTTPPKSRPFVDPPAPSAGGLVRTVGVAALTLTAAVASFSIIRALVPAGVPEAPGVAVEDPVAQETPAAQAVVPTVAESEPARSAAPSDDSPFAVDVGLPLPEGLVASADRGWIDIDSGDAHSIYVDDVFVGRGPRRRVPVGPGEHPVRLSLDGQETTVTVSVSSGKLSRLSAKPSP